MQAGGTRLPYPFARQHGVIDLGGDTLARICLKQGADPMALIEVRRVIGLPIEVETAAPAQFERKLSEVYSATGLDIGGAEDIGRAGGLTDLIDHMPAIADLLDTRDDAPIIRFINGLIAEAARLGASDVHIEPYDAHLVVRMRVDGVLSEAARLTARLGPLLVSRVKVMARLDIAERRLPQDGRISLALGGRTLDVRVSTLPSKAGERVVLRLLDRDKAELTLDDLGMPPAVVTAFRAALREPNGIVLVTGPTGSGKTTTLYAGLRLLNDGAQSILTVEDPVEYAVEGVGQTQVNAKVGMTFAAGLRAILRQDPDIVLVGEIRDSETAQIAVQASLTGHLVLSTVHTNDAIGAVTRLRDMGVEPFLLASTLRVILAQRLVRRLCPACRRADIADAAIASLSGIEIGAPVFRATGCASCAGTGYVGRVGLYEIVRIDDALRRLIGSNANESEMSALAFTNGATLSHTAREYVRNGVTTVEEAVRVIRQEANAHADL
ncbi:MAG: type II secretion system ATPase GspE [Alphaproteobacteria bacterium]|nr:type II secretion system ATPase GspE [Alphaproteobacteria bacterium]